MTSWGRSFSLRCGACLLVRVCGSIVVCLTVCGSVALSGTDPCCTITGGSTFILRSLTADIIDYDRFRTGENREAQYVGCVVVPGHS